MKKNAENKTHSNINSMKTRQEKEVHSATMYPIHHIEYRISSKEHKKRKQKTQKNQKVFREGVQREKISKMFLPHGRS